MPYQYPVLVAVMVQRLWETWVSRRRLQAALATEQGELIADRAWPAMVALHVGWIAGCWAEVLLMRPPFHAGLVLAMLGVWGAALALKLWMGWSLGELWNARLIGREEQPVVTAGPYRYIRHPNYLAVVLEIAAVPLLVGAYWTALAASLANAAVLWRRIRAEEAYLDSVEGYPEAFGDKARFIPGVF